MMKKAERKKLAGAGRPASLGIPAANGTAGGDPRRWSLPAAGVRPARQAVASGGWDVDAGPLLRSRAASSAASSSHASGGSDDVLPARGASRSLASAVSGGSNPIRPAAFTGRHLDDEEDATL